MGRILFVDDERDFEVLGFKMGQVDIYKAVNSSEAIDLIQTGKFSVLFLDHDLGMDFGIEDSGMEIVDYLVNVQHHPEIQYIFIHSQNPVGAVNMMNRLGPFYNVQRWRW